MASASIPEGIDTEDWSFESDFIDGPEIWRVSSGNRKTPRLNKLIAMHSAAKEPRKQRVAEPAADSVIAHMFTASDPVNAVMGGTRWSADAALKELSRKHPGIDEGSRIIILEDDPIKNAAQFSAVSDALDVGLIIESGSEGFTVVCTKPSKNIWLERCQSGWKAVQWCGNPVSRQSIHELIKTRARALASSNNSIKSLRSCAESIGLPKPLPRTKEGIRSSILEFLS